MKFEIFTDGACSGNPGHGGWAAVIVRGQESVQEIGGEQGHTTNNAMELRAVIEALKVLKNEEGKSRVHTDSKYVQRAMKEEWLQKWKKNGWKTAAGHTVQHQGLWMELDRLVEARDSIAWKHIHGHAGHPGNERADEIAHAFSQSEKPKLYNGNLNAYDIDLQAAPFGKPIYLSYVDGELKRHATWGECEALVQGRSGAKYKKVKSSVEEQKTLKAWGVKK